MITINIKPFSFVNANNNSTIVNPFTINGDLVRQKVLVDNWYPAPNEGMMENLKDMVMLPLSNLFFNGQSKEIDYFAMHPKRCYNNDKPNSGAKPYIVHYFNYFVKFYDYDLELISIYSKIKYMIDYVEDYTEDAFLYDLSKYIFSTTMMMKIDIMNEDNYLINLVPRKNDPCLQYTNRHGKLMMKMSMMMKLIIPLVSHYIYIHNILDINGFVLRVYDRVIFGKFPNVDIYTKLYETALYNNERSANAHAPLWAMQNIRGKNVTTHTVESVNNIILNTMPRYIYCKNPINFNFATIHTNNGYQITDVSYEYNFISLSSSKRDEDNNSEFDKFESYLIKQDESLYIQNDVNSQETMKRIDILFGPFDKEELDFYNERIEYVDGIQRELVFNMFYKYFGDPVSIKAINKEQYIKLLISARNMLEAHKQKILPSIITSKTLRLTNRKQLNKDEFNKITASPLWEKVMNKYKSEKMKKNIIALIATTISSEFEIQDFRYPELNGNMVEMVSTIASEEILMFIDMISE